MQIELWHMIMIVEMLQPALLTDGTGYIGTIDPVSSA